MLLIGVRARAVKEDGRKREHGWRSVCSLVVYHLSLSPASTAKCTHRRSHVCVFMCVRMHARGPVKLLNTLYIFILEDESGASN